MDETNWPTIAFLFIIALEVLLIHIRESSSISGIKIGSVSGVCDVSIFVQVCGWCLHACTVKPLQECFVLEFQGASCFGLRFRVPRFLYYLFLISR